tara:strand:- start:35905 stop:36195 length:291 start_codon:yes stop_codon:yes gene_type:complete
MKAYLIIDLKVVDLDGFMEYVGRIPALIEKYQGQYLVQGVEPEFIEGEGDLERSVVLEFPSRTLAREFLEARSQSDLHDIWSRTTASRILLVDGCT